MIDRPCRIAVIGRFHQNLTIFDAVNFSVVNILSEWSHLTIFIFSAERVAIKSDRSRESRVDGDTGKNSTRRIERKANENGRPKRTYPSVTESRFTAAARHSRVVRDPRDRAMIVIIKKESNNRNKRARLYPA
jgi:hypothetical protein